MAASIVCSVPVVAAGGKTATATLSAGSGAGYGPASGVTGATFYKFNAERFHVASATISGTTVTWTFDTVIPSGATRYWDLAGGSNITDGGGNSVVSQNTIQITNNSTTAPAVTLSVEDAGFDDHVSVAGIDLTSPGALVYNVKVSNSGVSQFEFSTDHVDLDMMIFTSGPTQPLSVYIGGVLQTLATVTDAGGAFNLMPILSGNSGTKAVKIVGTSQFYVTTNATFRGYGGTFISLPTGYGKSYPLKTVASFIDLPAPWAKIVDGANLPGVYNSNATDMQIGFKTTGGSGGATHAYRLVPVTAAGPMFSNLMLKPNGSVWLFGDRPGGSMALVTDGTEGGSLATLDSTGTTGWYQAASGLDATAINESATWTARRTAYGAGDSILLGESGPGASDTRQSYPHIIAKAIDCVFANGGVNGQGIQSAILLSGSAQEPTMIVIEWGTNQIQAGTAGATVTSTMTTLLNDTRTRFPNAQIILLKILPRYDNAGAYTASVATYNGYEQTAVTNVGDANTVFVDVSAGLDMTVGGTHSSDGLHPNAAGNVVIAANLQSYIAGIDTTPPTLSTATATDTTLTNAYSEIVSLANFTDYTITGGAAALALTSATGSGDDSAWDLTFSRTVYKAETALKLQYAGTGTTDVAGNFLATIVDKAITNNSAVICAVPSGASAIGYSTKIVVRWTANTEPVFDHYNVYTSATSNGTYVLVGTSTASVYRITGLPNDTQVFIKIESVDTAGNKSAKSTAVSATPTAAAGNEPRSHGSRARLGMGVGV